ncbi:carboxymuconolactone decarboxylase family protein [Actinoplanes sp. LDG1-06]|uniref:Carboxymuconolactone decarboxylase family protein n=1 Tax=Paractinoplanes ovalisporus TaxID=2810368 RepID=A0ABS2AGQ4_9ACTN|nr:carboxymuconolactone decarboxylase family protein [Actinoplanes ovalisporus]MBM2618426.1 carboxymuconolactone decarboxylase family protein [Actinoplanes ovalisporus]
MTGTLNQQQRATAAIAAFTATGRIPQLRDALGDGLDAGLSVNQVKEILVQMYAYAGFPRSLNALGTFMALLEQRRADGHTDPAGDEPKSLPAGTDMLEVGTANQTQLSGAPVSGPLFDFAPAIDRFLKTHLFGDIFSRDNLDWQSREIATVAALAGLEGLDSQLQSHFRIALNTGLTGAQLRELVTGLPEHNGRTAELLNQVLTGR